MQRSYIVAEGMLLKKESGVRSQEGRKKNEEEEQQKKEKVFYHTLIRR